jgi:glycosyltransferase involved in cell wall biosynthesis
LFLGSESHLPNQHGLKWFLDEVYRSYKIKIPLYVTGAWSGKFQNSVKNSNVKFVGFVENLDTLLMDAILVSPIFIGAGLRTKILLAMSRGVPVVSSSFSCNGICVENNKNILLADSGEEFHKSINLLVSNTDYYLDVSENAYDLIKEEFNKEVLAGKRRSCYQKIL